MATLADVFRAIDLLASESFVGQYAIGGTMAALFDAEATQCFEISVCTLCVRFPEDQTLSQWANGHGFLWCDGLVVVHGVPVRILEALDPLQIEAVCRAERRNYKGASIRLMRVEHLIAFYLDDQKSRWGYPYGYFAEEAIDQTFLEEVLEHESLLAKWRTWRELDAIEAPDAHRYVAKRRWHHENARLPVEEKVRQLLQLQHHVLPIMARHRELKWWENPWDIEP